MKCLIIIVLKILMMTTKNLLIKFITFEQLCDIFFHLRFEKLPAFYLSKPKYNDHNYVLNNENFNEFIEIF